MIKDEDVIKNNSSSYMKPHERVIYVVFLILGVLTAIAGIVMFIIGLSANITGLIAAGAAMIVTGIIDTVLMVLFLKSEKTK